MASQFEYLPVPRGDTSVYATAEAYFVERLTAHFRPKGYDCYREYAYGGGTTFMPISASVGHTDPTKARILRMLQGGNGAAGFRHTRPRMTENGLKDRGHQKPDFLAFRSNDGVIGEIGTANMRAEKLSQLTSRLRDLQRLVDEEQRVQSWASSGRPLSWSGMGWRAADFHPPEGPVVIPVDDDRLISTEPTFNPKVAGLYLYQLLRYRSHRLPAGRPVTLPAFSSDTAKQLKGALQRYQQQGGKPAPAGSKTARPLDAAPALRADLAKIAVVVGVAAVVVAAVAVAAPVGAAIVSGELIAGFGELLMTELGAAAVAAPMLK